jgi:hypothetical protein
VVVGATVVAVLVAVVVVAALVVGVLVPLEMGGGVNVAPLC